MKPQYEELEALVQRLSRQVRELEQLVSELRVENSELRSRLEKNSKNSSKPPSTDLKANLPPSNRGRRPYHPGTSRTLLPEEMVSSRETRVLSICPRCRSQMEPTGDSSKWQQIELPPIKPLVHQIELVACRCTRCSLLVTPELSTQESLLLGPRLEGLVNLLMAQFRQGHRPVRSFLEMLIPGLHLSQGLIAKIKQRASLAFDHATQALTQALLAEDAPKMIDATGWRHCGINWHAIVLRTQTAVRYAIVRHQNQDVTATLLDRKKHIMVSDRGFPLNQKLVRLHQYCLAHLLRNIRGMADHEGTNIEEAQTLGEVHETLQGLFHDRHRYKKGQIARSSYLMYGYRDWAYIRTQFESLAIGATQEKLRRFSRRVLRDWKKFMTYLSTDGPMTNNLAEEALRNLVIVRRLCFGSRSDYGRRWRECLHSCIETLRRRGGDVLDFLSETIRAFRYGVPYPVSR